MRLARFFSILFTSLLFLTGCTLFPVAQDDEDSTDVKHAEQTQPAPMDKAPESETPVPAEQLEEPATVEEPEPTPQIETTELSPLTEAFNKCIQGGDSMSYPEQLVDGECTILTPFELDHPYHGTTSFVLGTIVEGDNVRVVYWLLDEQGHVIERRMGEAGARWYLEAPRLDGSGNIIYTYNPGRADGCVALRPEGDWFEGFKTDPLEVPEGEPDYQTRFYGCTWVDRGTGTMEILYRPPGEATYNPTPRLFFWNGENYEEAGEQAIEEVE